MPEMVVYCGRRLTVNRRADKICDTVMDTGSRRIPNVVLLLEGVVGRDDRSMCR
jgi:hypothetical protein